MVDCENKFWIENVVSLFNNTNLIPVKNMKLEEQLNTMTRLIIVIFIIMILFNFKYSVQFLTISLIFIIIIYIIQKNKMKPNCKEGFNDKRSVLAGAQYITSSAGTVDQYTPPSLGINQYTQNMGPSIPPLYNPYATPDVSVNSAYAVGINQRLANAGTQKYNPKTDKAPYMVARTHDLEYWRENNLVNHSSTNNSSQREAYLSGYAVTTNCSNLKQSNMQVAGMDIEGFAAPVPTIQKPIIPSLTYTDGRPVVEGFAAPVPTIQKPIIPSLTYDQYGNPIVTTEGFTQVRPNQNGWVNTSLGYNPEQLNNNLPSNFPAGNCQNNKIMSEYNKNLFTQTVTPNVYFTNQIIEPISSNEGISFEQQFNPTSVTKDKYGNTIYVEHDPRVYVPPPEKPYVQGVNPENVYDPRSYGYGTSYRGYVDPLLGQPKFMYDDVDAVRMPAFISRSNIDHLPFAESIGVRTDIDQITPDIRTLTQDAWVNNSIDFRTDLQESLMRKRNSEMWQLREAPMHTNYRTK